VKPVYRNITETEGGNLKYKNAETLDFTALKKVLHLCKTFFVIRIGFLPNPINIYKSINYKSFIVCSILLA
jgi:hypothetical protein